MMQTVVGVVEKGRVRLPASVQLSEGQKVLVEWEEDWERWGPPLESEPLTAEDVQHDLDWATGTRFSHRQP